MRSHEQIVIRNALQGVYDVQKLRIASGQRNLAQFLAKLDLPPTPPPLPETATKEEKANRRKLIKEREEKINAFLEKRGIQAIESDDDYTEVEDKKKDHKKPTDFLKVILKEYKGITDWVTMENASIKRALEQDQLKSIISNQSEMEILAAYEKLKESEELLVKPVKRAVEEHPVWKNFLSDVRGVGPLMAGVLLSEFDIQDTRTEVSKDFALPSDYDGLNYVEAKTEEDGTVKYYLIKPRTVSSFWAYAGLDTTVVYVLDEEGNPILDENGVPLTRREGTGRKKEHLIKVTYINKKGEEKVRDSLTYNAFLKTKLLGVLGPGFLKAVEPEKDEDGEFIRNEEGKKISKPNYYAQIYFDYKNRLNNNPEHDGKTNGHKHNMAIRYMVKYFVQDFFIAWRLVEDLSIQKPYHEAKLGMKPHSKTSPALISLLRERAPHLLVA